jgi:hypothetical protein
MGTDSHEETAWAMLKSRQETMNYGHTSHTSGTCISENILRTSINDKGAARVEASGAASPVTGQQGAAKWIL